MKNGTQKKIVSAFLAVAMVFGLLPAMSAPARADSSSLYQPIAVTGYNIDMIINGTSGSTDKMLDCGFDSDNRSYYTNDFFQSFKTAYSLTRPGLPDDGKIISESPNYNGATYQLKDYNKDNALFLFSSGALTDSSYPYLSGLTMPITQGALTLEKPGAYETLLFLASSANGDSKFTATVNFSDGTFVKEDFTVYDWCTGSYTNYVALGDTTLLGRIWPENNSTDSTPKLYDCYINLAEHKTKLVKSITFQLTSSNNERAGIFALSGKRPEDTPDSPAMPDANSVVTTTTSFTAAWSSVADASGYYLDVATDPDFTNMLTGYNNKDVGKVTSYEITGLDAGKTYYYRVRSYNGNGSGFSSDTVTVTTSLVQTADASKNTITAGLNPILTGHTVTLTATGDRQREAGATSGDTRYIPKTWISDEAGTPGGAFTESGGAYTADYTPSAAGTYTVTASFQLQTYNGSAWSDTAGSTNSKMLNLKAEAAANVYTIDYKEETISFDGGHYEISTSSGFEPGTNLDRNDDINPGTAYYIREKGSSGPGVSSFITAARPATTALSVTVGGKTDTAITVGAIVGAEYSKDGGLTWQSSHLFTGLSPNTDYSITIRFASTAASFASSAVTPVTVRTKAGAPAAEPAVIKEQTANTISIDTLAGYQYAITKNDAEAASWSEAVVEAGSMTFTVLTGTTTSLDDATGYKIWARIAETGTSVASDAVAVNGYTAQTTPAAGTGYTINYSDETLTSVDGYELSTTSDFSGAISHNSAITPGAVYYVRKAAVGAIPAGAVTSFATAARPAAPSLVTGVDESYKNKNDGKLANLTEEMEYRVSGSPKWSGVTADQAANGVTGLADSTYEIRLKAVTDRGSEAFASEIHTVTIVEGNTITISFNSMGGSTVAPFTGQAYGDKIIAPEDPTKNGYYFGGWFQDTNCTQNWIFETDTISADKTLYAKWNAIPVYTIKGAVLGGSGDPVSGASVKLLRGIVQYGSTTETSERGDFEIPYVPSGTYNLVITKDDRKVIILVTVAGADAAVGNVTLPAGEINSTLVISGSSTPNVIVDGLNQEAGAQYRAGESVEITLNVEEKASEVADNGDEVATAIAASGQIAGMLLDITIKKVVNGDEDTAYNETLDLIQIIIPLPEALQGKKTYKIYRYHRGSVDAITNEANNDGESFTVNSDKTQLTLNVMKFSTYGIAYTENTSSSSSKSHAAKPVVGESASEGAWANPYSDVRDKDWWYEAVCYVTENGLMNGTGSSTFGPKLTTTRGMIITILYRLEGKPETAGTYTFKDVSSSQYYADAVAWGAANTIIKGYDEDRYRPEKNITREQLAAILYRYAQYKGNDVTAWDDLASYVDSADVAKWALANMQWAVGKDLMSGTDQGALLPGSDCTRAQTAMMLMRFLAK